MLYYDGKKFVNKEIIVDDKFIQSKIDDILEHTYHYLSDIEIEDRAVDYLEVQNIAPECLYQIWHNKHYYNDVWDKVEDAFANILKSNNLYNKSITETDVELYNESFNDAVCEIAELELNSKMKFFGVQDLNLDESLMKERGEYIWWKKYDNVDSTETRVWLIYVEHYYSDEVQGLHERVTEKGHYMYKSRYGGDVTESDRQGNNYKNWGTVRG